MSKPRLRANRYLLPICLVIALLVVLFVMSFIITEHDITANQRKLVNAYAIHYDKFKRILSEFSKNFNKQDKSETQPNNQSVATIVRRNASVIKALWLSKKIAYKIWSNNQRLWFMPNGTIRPDPEYAQRLALWPDEGDLDDDRVVNQLMYVPRDYDPKRTRVKKIFLKADDSDWGEPSGDHEFSKCAVSTCSHVNQSEAAIADLIFFKDYYTPMRFERPSHQIWLLFVLESVRNTLYIDVPRNAINWTATYRHDSDISTPYAKFVPYYASAKRSDNFNYASNKTKLVAWFVSNCAAKNMRLEYALELKRYVQVDIYGDCGTLQCSRVDPDLCYRMLDRDYKFYLSFENSNCKDYITEKFWHNALNHNIVPIVMGAQKATYKRFAPSNSFIHVDDFSSPKHLALHLEYLNRNDREYNKYFAWKGSGQVMSVMMWCRVCALLHAPHKQRVYDNFRNWWSVSDQCVDNRWINKIRSTNQSV